MKRKLGKKLGFLFVCGCREKSRQFFILNKGAINEKITVGTIRRERTKNKQKNEKRGG